MPTIDLDDTECGQLMAVLAHAEGKGITWATVNPLMMKIGSQLRAQHMESRNPEMGRPGRHNNSETQSP